ncbi:hypothetical protein B0H63DRAFT_529258 [Podospora didyma]|uniref:F-box domain-containing protein n=1 Tax=Podospora didyma TaxID=330526 RepID=A0AAE0K029_9PEZI|nr:hypothetical protein B0H63DRAFT_529258 [Podospora didyma]
MVQRQSPDGAGEPSDPRTHATQHRYDSASDTIVESHATADNAGHHGGPMHPLIATAFTNKTASPLCRLPDPILARLMRHMDPITVECLRRTSRTFMRLFSEIHSTFAEEYRTRHLLKQPFHPWRISTIGLTDEERNRLVSTLQKDQYCKGCKTARESRD